MAKPGRKKGVILSKETIAKIQAKNKARRERLGPHVYVRDTDVSGLECSITFTWSTGRRIWPKRGAP